MSIEPLITFKAGKCDADFSVQPPKVKPEPTPGYLYLWNEDELIHLCWRARDASLSNPELDLLAVPTDCTFRPYTGLSKPSDSVPKSPVNGRIFVLKFSSSSQRHLFWLQSREQPPGDASKFSQRDLRLGEIVDNILQGGEMEADDLDELRNGTNDRNDDGDDETMEDVDGNGPEPDHARTGSGGAGADATGGDVREEGAGSREGGADGGRAVSTESGNVNLHQLLASIGSSGGGIGQRRPQASTTLQDLLIPSITIPALARAPISVIDELLLHRLPPQLLFLEAGLSDTTQPSPQPSEALARLSEGQKRGIVSRVLRAPQLTQAMSSITSAIRDGGLPGVSEALAIQVPNGGWTGPGKGRGQPLTGGAAVEAFLEGVRNSGSSDFQETQDAPRE